MEAAFTVLIELDGDLSDSQLFQIAGRIQTAINREMDNAGITPDDAEVTATKVSVLVEEHY